MNRTQCNREVTSPFSLVYFFERLRMNIGLRCISCGTTIDIVNTLEAILDSMNFSLIFSPYFDK